MPFIRITTNEKVTKGDADLLTAELGKGIELINGKSERWLMLEYKGEMLMAFAGNDDSCAMVEVDLFGEAKAEEKNNLTDSICRTVSSILHVPSDRIYVRYLETDTWGYDHENF